ncbi:MAG: hypothetical protein KatS3mg076_1393 [Candidatus Binatia bacterium]|nr:MAG: hypothetical protein KatS3mg076_1393 [Candidatus Binatia bacterium]
MRTFLGTLFLFVLLVGLSAPGCGGSGEGSGMLGFRALWQRAAGGAAGDFPEPGAGFGTELPRAVKTVRLLFESETGFRCCVAFDPRGAPTDPATGERFVVLSPLPVGPATLHVSGFPSGFAPTEREIRETCPLEPGALGRSCSLTQVTAPSFSSDPRGVTVVAGVESDAGDILLHSFPFVIVESLEPPPRSAPSAPFDLRLTVAEALAGVDADSILVEIVESTRLVRTVEIVLDPCSDDSPNVCSPGGELGVDGFHVSAAAARLGRPRSDPASGPGRQSR